MIEKDVYINFKSQASSVVIVVPEGVNVTCDIEKVASRVRNEVINVDEEGIHTVYVIGNASVSNVDIIPVDFYGEDEDFEDEDVEAEADESNTDDAADAGESGENTVEAKPEVKADVDEKAEKSDGDRDDTDETDEIPLQEV